MKLFNIITAVDNKNGIGKNNSIPWHKKDTMLSHIDLQFFKNKTSGHTVIMGRKTYESMNKRLLPNRINIIISTTLQDPQLNIAKSFQNQFQSKVTSRSQFEITSGRPGAEWVVEQNGTSHLCISLKFNVDSIWKIFYTKFDKSYKGDKSYAVAQIGLPVSAIFPFRL